MNATYPTSTAPVPGPARGTLLTKEYVRAVGRMADICRWPLASHGVLPLAFNGVTMLTDDISPDPRMVAGPNPDAADGFAMSSLDTEPIVIEAEDFGDRFWIFPLDHRRSDVFSLLDSLANASDRHHRRP
jgi:hypothetical protein